MEFRLRYLADERARAVIEAAADRARPARAQAERRGRGIAFAQYKNRQATWRWWWTCAWTGPAARSAWSDAVIAADAGQIVNPEA